MLKKQTKKTRQATPLGRPLYAFKLNQIKYAEMFYLENLVVTYTCSFQAAHYFFI